MDVLQFRSDFRVSLVHLSITWNACFVTFNLFYCELLPWQSSSPNQKISELFHHWWTNIRAREYYKQLTSVLGTVSIIVSSLYCLLYLLPTSEQTLAEQNGEILQMSLAKADWWSNYFVENFFNISETALVLTKCHLIVILQGLFYWRTIKNWL